MKRAVPREDRQAAFWPPLDCLCGMAARNIEVLDGHDLTILGTSARDLRRECTSRLFEAACSYAREIEVPCPAGPRRPIVVTGHQSELVHAGVWIKNHLAYELGRSTGGSSLNLIVDNDAPKHLSLVFPAGTAEQARRVAVPYAAWKKDVAYEEYPAEIVNKDGFRQAVQANATGVPFEPEIKELLNRMERANGGGRSISDLIAMVRLSYERPLGIVNAEVPVSRMCETAAFWRFFVSICRDGQRFLDAYNGALADYRRAEKVRYSSTPVPDLAVEGDLVEVPFWGWRSGGPRRRLFVNTGQKGIRFHMDADPVGELHEASVEGIEAFRRSLAVSGVKIRPRALSMTLFVRMFVADVFIHGIGGARYDEVTDGIIRSFYAVEPPEYATVTATLALPWGIARVDGGEMVRLTRTLRDMEYNPDGLMSDPSHEELRLIAEKHELVSSRPADASGRRSKFERIRAINGRLSRGLGESKAAAAAKLDQLRRRRRAEDILFDREYPCFVSGAERTAEFYRGALAGLAKSC